MAISLVDRIADILRRRRTPEPPAPPAGPAPTANFDLVVDPPGVYEVTIEGYQGGPQITHPDGYVYIQGLRLPPTPDLDHAYLGDRTLMIVGSGYDPFLQHGTRWEDFVAFNQAGGHNHVPAGGMVPIIKPLPPAPSRLEVLSARTAFQGVMATTREFGTFPAFGPETTTLADDDLISYCRQMLVATDDVGQRFDALEIALSWNYDEPRFRYPVPGRDLSQNLPELRRRIKLMIQTGVAYGLKAINLYCAGDGESPAGGGYSDPAGWTYGREWLLANFQRIYNAMGPQPDDPEDLRDWIVFLPCYDGGDAYQWKTSMNAAVVWRVMRRVVDAGGHGYVAFEWPAGQVHLGDDFPTFAQENAGCIDAWHLELPPGPYPLPHGRDDYNQINAMLGRYCRVWNPPPDFQKNEDDRWPMPYLPIVTARGAQVVQVREFRTYLFVRDRDVAACNRDRQWIRRAVPGAIIC